MRSTPPGAGQASSRCTTPSPPWRARSNSGSKVSAPRVELGDAAAERLIGPEAQQRLRGGVQIQNLEIVIQQEHAGHQGIEQLGALDVQSPAD